MNAIVIEHVPVAELPEAWRNQLAVVEGTRVTVRIEAETVETAAERAAAPEETDAAFGIWRDRDDVVDVSAYVRKIREPRYKHDGTRNED